jgi:cytidylate kinase
LTRLLKVIVISGAISSGKSTVAKQIAEKHALSIASFGGFLKHYCSQNNLPINRKNLQDIGDKFIDSQPEKFLLDVIDFSDNGSGILIFEGVRHKVILDLLRKHSTEMLSIFINASYDTRKERYLARNKDIDSNKSAQEFDLANSHPVEREISSLAHQCDLSIASIDDRQLLNKLMRFMET